MLSSTQIIYEHLCRAKVESDVDRRVEILKEINKLLPTTMKIQVPSLVTNRYIDSKLNSIEDQIMGTLRTEHEISVPHHLEHTRQLHCQCGNLIQYDDLQLNCDFPEHRIITCNSCQKSHRIVVDGRLASLAGAT
jgi:hypothetical protein